MRTCSLKKLLKQKSEKDLLKSDKMTIETGYTFQEIY